MIYAAFILGLVGNIHCFGMCGPIALALPIHHLSPRRRFLATLVYSLGRVLTYVVLGVLIGLIGTGFSLSGWQTSLTIFSGVVLILMVLIPRGFSVGGKITTSFQKLISPLRNQMVVLLKSGNSNALFILGMLNGLLPCGMVYAALALTLSATSIPESALTMAAFGMGTTPVLGVLMYQSGLFKKKLGKGVRFLVPLSVFILGSILVLRGLSLDIPYLSPVLEAGIVNTSDHSCH